MSPADISMLCYAFSRAHVPAPRLFNRLAGLVEARLNGTLEPPPASPPRELARSGRAAAGGGGGGESGDDGDAASDAAQVRRHSS